MKRSDRRRGGTREGGRGIKGGRRGSELPEGAGCIIEPEDGVGLDEKGDDGAGAGLTGAGSGEEGSM